MFGFFKKEGALNNNVVIVLGMHRSGTSCLTGLLQQAGVALGNVVKEAAHNKKGNRFDFFDNELRHQIELSGAALQQFAALLEPAMSLYKELQDLSIFSSAITE